MTAKAPLPPAWKLAPRHPLPRLPQRLAVVTFPTTQRPYPAARQAAQRTELLEVLAAGAPGDTILAGDLNSTPWSFALRTFDAASGLTRYDRAMPTWPATNWTRLRLPAPEAFDPAPAADPELPTPPADGRGA